MPARIFLAVSATLLLAPLLSLAKPLDRPPLPASKNGEPPLYLVRHGAPKAAIITPAKPPEAVAGAVASFIEHVREATGATLPLLPESQAGQLTADTLKIHVGDTEAARAQSINLNHIEEESYRIHASAEGIIIVGRDARKETPHSVDSLPTRWALNQLLDQYLGVRWLWPGKLGTFIPKSSDFSVPPMDVTYQPDLIFRRLRLIWPWMTGELLESSGLPVLHTPEERGHLLSEAAQWLENHQNGQRRGIRYGHAFAHWWERYSKDHPEYFAIPPAGITQPKPKETHVKLRLSNPAVIEQIAAEYQERGAPAIYNVCPNDGYGFDTSPETREWDIPAGQEIHDIWIGNGNLTARYVTFWNRLYERLRQINPDVTLISYAYASYRQPPPPERPLKARMILGIVDSFSAYENWSKWSETGARMILRPNWWVVGADAPHLPLRKMADFIRFTRENNLIGIDKDAISGYWATQGLNYYMLARLMERPDLGREEIIGEYTSAFGRAGEKIRQYIAYWEAFTTRAAYPNHAGSIVSEDPQGLYERHVKEHGISFNPRLGSYWIMPYIYTDEVLAEAGALLEEASAIAGTDDTETLARIAFLQSGLADLRAMRDLIAAAAALKKTPNSKETRALFNSRVNELLQLRRRLSPTHAVWGELLYTIEDKLRIPSRPENLDQHAPDLRGE